MKDDILQKYIELFSGYEHAHGRYRLSSGNASAGDKLRGQARTISQPLLENDILSHLNGQGGDGIGAIPLKEDNTVVFAAIDIDDYRLDIEKLLEKTKRFPLVPCRSKSGGVHLYMFFEKPISAEIVVDKMREIAAFIGYGTVEVFPKQTYRYDKKDIGNWINLPYYDHENTKRYAFFNTSEQLSLEQFVDIAYEKRQTLEQIQSIGLIDNNDDKSSLFYGAPPCLKYLFSMGGFPQGSKNNGMTSVAVYLKKRFPDDWEQKMAEYAVEMCGKNVPLNEINSIVKSVSKKDYSYMCKQSPLCDHCDKRKCLQQEFV